MTKRRTLHDSEDDFSDDYIQHPPRKTMRTSKLAGPRSSSSDKQPEHQQDQLSQALLQLTQTVNEIQARQVAFEQKILAQAPPDLEHTLVDDDEPADEGNGTTLPFLSQINDNHSSSGQTAIRRLIEADKCEETLDELCVFFQTPCMGDDIHSWNTAELNIRDMFSRGSSRNKAELRRWLEMAKYAFVHGSAPLYARALFILYELFAVVNHTLEDANNIQAKRLGTASLSANLSSKRPSNASARRKKHSPAHVTRRPTSSSSTANQSSSRGNASSSRQQRD